MKQDIENIIKNLPKYKNGSKAIPKDDIVVQYSALSLIADEVLKVVVEKIDNLINKRIDDINDIYENKDIGWGHKIGLKDAKKIISLIK